MTSKDEALHPNGFLDDDFAAFRAQRLKEKKTQALQAVDDVAETGAAAPAPTDDAPSEGYLDDEFAKFREQRLRKTGKLPRPEPEPQPEPDPDEGLFFGTSSNERRQLRARESARRATANVDSATRRLLRKQERAS